MGERYYCKHCGLDIGNSETRMCRDRDGDMCEPKPRTAKREERAHVDTIADLRAKLARAVLDAIRAVPVDDLLDAVDEASSGASRANDVDANVIRARLLAAGEAAAEGRR